MSETDPDRNDPRAVPGAVPEAEPLETSSDDSGAGGGGINLPRALWRRKWIILLSVALCVGGMVVYLSQATRIYRSSSTIYIQKRGPKVLNQVPGAVSGRRTLIGTQIAVIKSTRVLSKAAEKLGTANMAFFEGVSNPVGALKSIEVSREKRRLLRISAESPHKSEVATVVNAVVEAYIDFQKETQRDTTAEVLSILRREKSRRDDELGRKFSRMVEFRREHPELALVRSESTQDSAMPGSLTTDRLQSLRAKMTEAQIRKVETKNRYQTFKRLAEKGEDINLMLATGNEAVMNRSSEERSRLQNEILRLENRLEQLRSMATDEHEDVKKLEKKLEERRTEFEKLDERLNREWVNSRIAVLNRKWELAKSKFQQLEKAYQKERDKVLDISEKQARYAKLRADWKRTKQLVNTLDKRIESIDIDDNNKAFNVNVLEVAKEPGGPVKPDERKMAMFSVLFGCLLGGGLAIGLELLDQRVRNPEELTTTLGLTVLGLIPRIRERGGTASSRTRFTSLYPSSPVAEAFRTVRTALFFGLGRGGGRAVLLTSAGQGDGKTTVAGDLAITLAQAGYRTALVDADLRKQTFHEVFDVKRVPGLAELVSGENTTDEVIHPAVIENLDLITAGQSAVNPAELVGSQAMGELLGELRSRYDMVLLDSPPVVPVADSRELARLCDGTILVVRIENSTYKGVRAAKRALASGGTSVLGAVANAAEGQGGYGYYYYRYQKGYGYGESGNGQSKDASKRTRGRRSREKALSGEGDDQGA